MLEKIVRSPLTQLFFLILLFGVFGIRLYMPSFFNEHMRWLTVGLLGVVGLFFIFVFIHNRKHPEWKITIKSWQPYEFKEEDEGLKWVTFQACRKVYIFYSFAIPISLIVLTSLHHYPYVPFVILFFIGVSQYVIYWWEERKYFKTEGDLE